MNTDHLKALWCEVLILAIHEALEGVGSKQANTPELRIKHIEANRRYITEPNKDFNMVCTMAGVDPDIIRERVTYLIAQAPTPEELVQCKARRKQRNSKDGLGNHKAGGGSDFGVLCGTGGGRSAQDSPKISFSNDRKAA